LWGSDTDTVAALLGSAGSAVIAARAVEAGLPLFGPLVRLNEPGRGDPYRLHHRLTMLRYLRSDVHVAVLADEGLSPRDARVVDALWRGAPSERSYLDHSLQDDGWIDSTGTALTALGRRRRDAIEVGTNRRIGAALNDASPDQVAALCDLLPRLPH